MLEVDRSPAVSQPELLIGVASRVTTRHVVTLTKWWAEPEVSNVTGAIQVDLRVDLNTMDETGLPWALLDESPNPSLIVAGHHIVVGSGAATPVAIVVDITGRGTVHVQPMRGSVASNADPLDADRGSSV